MTDYWEFFNNNEIKSGLQLPKPDYIVKYFDKNSDGYFPSHGDPTIERTTHRGQVLYYDFRYDTWKTNSSNIPTLIRTNTLFEVTDATWMAIINDDPVFHREDGPASITHSRGSRYAIRDMWIDGDEGFYAPILYLQDMVKFVQVPTKIVENLNKLIKNNYIKDENIDRIFEWIGDNLNDEKIILPKYAPVWEKYLAKR